MRGSSSPQISAILDGEFTRTNGSLYKYPQKFRNNCADKYTNPGSQNYQPGPGLRGGRVLLTEMLLPRVAQQGAVCPV